MQMLYQLSYAPTTTDLRSGLLLTTPVGAWRRAMAAPRGARGVTYNYVAASGALVEQAQAMARIIRGFGTTLPAAAAIQFPLRHEAERGSWACDGSRSRGKRSLLRGTGAS